VEAHLEPLPDQSLSDAVAERLRAAIRSGMYGPGDRLVERRVARQLGVSHIPVREALTRLEEEGLVERLPRRGARVALLTPQMLEEVSSLRIVLEQLVVRRVQDQWTAGAGETLQHIVDRMKDAAGRVDREAVHDCDQEFHEELWRIADHKLLLDVVAQLRGRTNHFFRAAAASLGPQELLEHAESHQRLLDIIAAGNARAAERAMKDHVATATRRIGEAQRHHGQAPVSPPEASPE
jgi:DNA-binding GntR family transcriptional regulator